MALVVFNPLRKEEDYSNAPVVEAKGEEPVTLAQEKELNETVIVHTTVYHAVKEQCNSDPEHTATMFKLDMKNPHKHKIIALSRDLLKQFPYHSKVILTGTQYDGEYVVEDTMNKRYTGRADILINKGMDLGNWKYAKIRKAL